MMESAYVGQNGIFCADLCAKKCQGAKCSHRTERRDTTIPSFARMLHFSALAFAAGKSGGNTGDGGTHSAGNTSGKGKRFAKTLKCNILANEGILVSPKNQWSSNQITS